MLPFLNDPQITLNRDNGKPVNEPDEPVSPLPLEGVDKDAFNPNGIEVRIYTTVNSSSVLLFNKKQESLDTASYIWGDLLPFSLKAAEISQNLCLSPSLGYSVR